MHPPGRPVLPMTVAFQANSKGLLPLSPHCPYPGSALVREYPPGRSNRPPKTRMHPPGRPVLPMTVAFQANSKGLLPLAPHCPYPGSALVRKYPPGRSNRPPAGHQHPPDSHASCGSPQGCRASVAFKTFKALQSGAEAQACFPDFTGSDPQGNIHRSPYGSCILNLLPNPVEKRIGLQSWRGPASTVQWLVRNTWHADKIRKPPRPGYPAGHVEETREAGFSCPHVEAIRLLPRKRVCKLDKEVRRGMDVA